ncbi:MAG: hypothetical protein CVV46_03095 [Spirochaetae bacterium HGW-Spirochaetae-2]|nr:MAG: hypothetical protein CVV46_03095 [Spirochaetae bacterium HGW-Spirochaetae-2]
MIFQEHKNKSSVIVDSATTHGVLSRMYPLPWQEHGNNRRAVPQRVAGSQEPLRPPAKWIRTGSVQLFKDLHDEKIMKAILWLNFALKCLTQSNRRIRHHPLVITSDTTAQLSLIYANAGMRLQAGSSLQGKSILNIREKVVL